MKYLPSLVLGADFAFPVEVDFAGLLFFFPVREFLDLVFICMTATSKGQESFGIILLCDEISQRWIPNARSRGTFQASKVDHTDVLIETEEKSGKVKGV